MSNDIVAYASVLRLTRYDVKKLNIRNAYDMHKVIYGLFEDVRSDFDKHKSQSSGILWADKGGRYDHRQVIMLSDRKPHQTPQFGEVETKIIPSGFLDHSYYQFEITLNPSKRNKNTGKVEPIRGNEEQSQRQAIAEWAKRRAHINWGFDIIPEKLQVQIKPVLQINKGKKTVTHGRAVLQGIAKVNEKDKFKQSFTNGIGRGKSFGLGLFQIVPLQGK